MAQSSQVPWTKPTRIKCGRKKFDLTNNSKVESRHSAGASKPKPMRFREKISVTKK